MVSNSFVTQWTVACQASLSMGFPRRECWSGLPFPSAGDLPDPGIEPASAALQARSLPSEPPLPIEKLSSHHITFFPIFPTLGIFRNSPFKGNQHTYPFIFIWYPMNSINGISSGSHSFYPSIFIWILNTHCVAFLCAQNQLLPIRGRTNLNKA